MHLPDRPPFVLRARVLSPLASGGLVDHPDGIIAVDARGRIAWVGDAAQWAIRVPPERPGGSREDARAIGPDHEDDRLEPIDLRPLVVMPGMVDLHAHLPQLPNAGYVELVALPPPARIASVSASVTTRL